MPSASKTTSVAFGSTGFSNMPAVVTSDGELDTQTSLPVGKIATAWVKTDANTAACNLAANHGIVTGKVDVYFAAGSRYGVDAIVTVNAVALDGGTGTDFPANAAPDCVVSQQVTITFPLVSTALKFLRLINVNTSDTTGKVSADIQTSAPASLARYLLVHQTLANGMSGCVDVSNGETNPISGTAATIRASNSSLIHAATFYAGAIFDATP